MIKPNKNLSTIFDFLVNRLEYLKTSAASIYHTKVCTFCRGPTKDSKRICSGCLLDLQWNIHHCPICAEPSATGSNEICGQCQSSRPSYDKIFAPLIYSFPLNVCIQRFKYGGQRHYGNPFSDLLSQALTPSIETVNTHANPIYCCNNDLPQCLIAVPMTRAKLRKRPYNHSELLCRQLAKHFDLQFQKDVIFKSRDTPPQAGLKRKERISNLKNSFAYVAKCTPKHVAIIDDVVTTGATAHTISALLKDHGVERVDVWALARTEKS